MSRIEKDFTPEISFPRHIHFIGIGGDGMSGLANILQEQGHRVSGSENIDPKRIKQPQMLRRLTEEGAIVNFGHCPENILPSVGLVVYSSLFWT